MDAQPENSDGTGQGRVATAVVTIEAPLDRIWNALVNPAVIKQYMAGATVETDWKPGSDIRWRGEWKGKPFEDKGSVLAYEPNRRLAFSHFSPMAGEPDVPENYHRVVIELQPDGNSVRVALSQDNNKTDDARRHSEENWRMMLAGLKKIVEG